MKHDRDRPLIRRDPWFSGKRGLVFRRRHQWARDARQPLLHLVLSTFVR
jgi:hypothetical protein